MEEIPFITIMDETKNVDYTLSEDEIVDDIFAQADMEMDDYRQKNIREQKEKKKMPRFKKIFIEIIVCLVICVIVIAAIATYTLSKTKPVFEEVKNSVISSFITLQTELKDRSDSNLSEKEKIQKELLLLLDQNDLKKILEQVSLTDLTNNNELIINRTMVSEEKYQKILELQKRLEELDKVTAQETTDTTENQIETRVVN